MTEDQRQEIETLKTNLLKDFKTASQKMWLQNDTLTGRRKGVKLEELANAARFIIFSGEEHVITLKAAGTGQALETMKRLATSIKDMIENEGYRVTIGSI